MIVQIRGTSGSGKTTVMRKIMEGLGHWSPEHIEGRKQPWLSRSYHGTDPTNIVVLGHYESACGGCDNIGSAPQVYDCIKGEANADIFLTEGLLWSEDVNWTVKLVEEGYDVKPLFLTTPLAQCIEWILKRRAEAGNTKPFNSKITVRRHRTVERARQRFLAQNVNCFRVSPNQAAKTVLNWIRNY